MDCIEAHKYCFENKTMLKKDKKCGCFYCCTIISSDEIEIWIKDKNDYTALCPYCFVDSVIGESVGYPLTKESLEKMYEVWFE